MTTQERIKRALDDLATAPEPVDLADRALRAAGRRRATNIGGGVVAAGLVLALAAVGVTHLTGHGAARTGGGGSSGGPCVQYTSGSNGQPDVPRDEWPDFVSKTVAALPARSDYSMQSGYGWCGLNPGMTRSPNDGLYIAYAVVNLGINREAGELTINVAIDEPSPPRVCSAATAAEHEQLSVLFCVEATSTTPVTYALGGPDGYARATAVYGDGTLVYLEYYGNAITPQQLAAAAADPGLYAIIPSDVPPVTN